MMTKYIKPALVVAVSALALSSCSDFLSTPPDDRQEADNTKALQLLMISAYPEYGMYNLAAELSSDNVQQAPEVPSTNPIFDQVFAWEDPTERNNNSPEITWQGHYRAVNTANKILEQLSALESTPQNRALRGEALVARAYGHFVLMNMFAKAYDPTTATQLLGVPYVTASEKSIDFTLQRETLADNYAHVAADLEAGIPLLDDANLTGGSKFRFNRQAAYAFAARFYLYYQRWAQAISYADLALGATPRLRDYDAIASIASDLEGFNLRAIRRQEVGARNNLLLIAYLGTQSGVYFSPGYLYGQRYNHHLFVNGREVFAKAAWWTAGQTDDNIKVKPLGDVQKVALPVYNYQLAPYGTSQVAATTFAEFTTDETLLVRAEAQIQLGNYTAALSDMNLWLANYTTSYAPLTEASVEAWNATTNYATPRQATPRKRLTPTFEVRDRKHEDYLQVLLHIRRIETLHTGLRWFDIKRYGIEVERVSISINGAITPLGNVLSARDHRQAIQIPQSVIAAGLEANPRD